MGLGVGLGLVGGREEGVRGAVSGSAFSSEVAGAGVPLQW